ncbi:MAG TPA: hypothetical protein VI874_03220, partial [Candidatus Norongarragalinales archaeon]|nr:hypothetical protein [Candidatus Norongarragalinales archaeon]
MPVEIAHLYEKIVTRCPSVKAALRAVNYHLSAGNGAAAGSVLLNHLALIGTRLADPLLGVVLRNKQRMLEIFQSVENTTSFQNVAQSAQRSMTKDARDVKTRNEEAQKATLYPALYNTLTRLQA